MSSTPHATSGHPLSAVHGKRLYLVDGSGFIFRAYHSLPPLTRSDGTPVGAVYGYVNMLMKVLEGMDDGGYAAVIFDAARKTFRNDIYPEYKAHRPPAPDDLIPQFPLVRDATRAMNLPSIEMIGFEADDLIASYTKAARADGMEVIIVSSDKDLMQLVQEGVHLLDPMKQKTIGRAEVIEKFGVPPELVVDAQALIGDSSDNVPGVPGIGPKTAAELILAYGGLEQVLARASEIKQEKRRQSLIEFAEQARISRRLVELRYDVPLPVPLDELKLKSPDTAVLLPFLQAQNFKSLVTRAAEKYHAPLADRAATELTPAQAPIVEASTVAASAVAPPVVAQVKYSLVTNEADLLRWIAQARAAGAVAFDTETTGLDATRAELVGVSLAIEPGTACYIPVGHVAEGSEPMGSVQPLASQQDDLFAAPASKAPALRAGQLPLKRVLELLKPLLADPAVLKIGQNIKYDSQILHRYGLAVTPVDDTMLMSYVLDAGLGNHNMDELAERHLGMKTITYAEVVGSGRNKLNFSQVDLEKARDYAAEDADITLRLHRVLKQRVLDEHMVAVYETIERPLIPVLQEMEAHGIKVDTAQLNAMSKDFGIRLAQLEQEIHALAGHEFNVGSPKQLGEVLFDEMQLPGGKKSAKTGAYATGADVLEELAAQGHALPAKLLEWRQLAKLKSTYSDALFEQINPATGRVHTSYSMAVASTGRLSSTDPNLQNIPIRTEEGRKIRKAFIADKGNKLISADYSQIELRLLAHVAGIDVLKEAFRNGRDIHATTASQMFGVPLEQIDGELRRKAKGINFGIIYGISAHGLAANLGISRGEAGAYIEKYFQQYPGIKAYMDEAKAYAHAHGYVKTLFGRKIHVKDINNKNGGLRQFSERAAINAPLQGTAADIIKRAMISLHRKLKETFPEARMLLQVHDELVIEVPEAQAADVARLVKAEMEGAAALSIPLTVDVSSGDDWGSIH